MYSNFLILFPFCGGAKRNVLPQLVVVDLLSESYWLFSSTVKILHYLKPFMAIVPEIEQAEKKVC